MHAVSRVGRLLAAVHRWKNSHQYLGRYSVEKLYSFNYYQRHHSATRVAAVMLAAPMPVLAVILAMEAIALGNPGAGLKQNSVALVRSIVSHTVMTFAMLLTVKKAIRLPDDGYSMVHIAVIAALVGVALEVFWLPFMVVWRYPVPFRELLGLVPFSALLVGCNWMIARDVLIAKWASVQVILPIMGAQLTLFYTFLGLSIGFAYVPLAGQTAMVLFFPIVKVLLKKLLWRYSQRLDDISTDVTICMVEISGSLYQTVCLQHVQSLALGVLIMVLDFVQAVVEVRLYTSHDYVVDNRSTLHTAVKIIESALFPSVQGVDKPRVESGPPAEDVNRKPFRWWKRKTSNKVHSFGLVKAPAVESIVGASHTKALRGSFEASAHSLLIAPQSLNTHCPEKQLLDLASFANSLPVPSPPMDGGEAVVVLSGTIEIDGIPIDRRDQARVLEQSLQLLFSCEVLLFVEFMEVLMPFVYAVYVGVAWHLPNAKYNYVLMEMTHKQMVQSVASSLIYAVLEAISLAVMCWLMQRKYGIRPLFQLAYVLENYWMTLHGKLVGTFITIVNSATVHQGIDFTFKFQYGAS